MKDNNDDALEKLLNKIKLKNPKAYEEYIALSLSRANEGKISRIAPPQVTESCEGYTCHYRLTVINEETPDKSRTIFYPGSGIHPYDNSDIVLRDDRYFMFSALSHSKYYEWVRETRNLLGRLVPDSPICDNRPKKPDNSITFESTSPARYEYGEGFRRIYIHSTLHITIFDDGLISVVDRNLPQPEMMLSICSPVENPVKVYDKAKKCTKYVVFSCSATDLCDKFGKKGGNLQLSGVRLLNGSVVTRFSIEATLNVVPKENLKNLEPLKTIPKSKDGSYWVVD